MRSIIMRPALRFKLFIRPRLSGSRWVTPFLHLRRLSSQKSGVEGLIDNTPHVAPSIEHGIPGVQPHADGNLVAMFTCKVCEVRSARLISKRAYEHGVVLVKCPGCLNLHLLADRAGWFKDEEELENLSNAHAEAVRRGTLSPGTDSNVIGLQPDDLLVLSSLTKSVNLKTGEDVDVKRFH
jgi:hypothetical protein